MSVVSFVGYVPLERFDEIPWTKARIEEGPTETGPWTLLEVITFLDPDVDPANPKVRDFTTELATLADGWYRIIFEDATGDFQSPTNPVHDTPGLADSFLPLISDIGALLRARTKDNLGNEVGTFTAATRPTGEEVLRLIDQAASDVTALVDYDLPVEVYAQARDVIAIGTAMRVELSYYPEQIGANKSAYPQYREMYNDALARLLTAVTREAAEELTGEVPMFGQMAAFGFPVEEGLLFKRM